MSSPLEQAKARVDGILSGYQRAIGIRPQSMLSPEIEAGKVYELWVLCRLLEQLHQQEGFEVLLRGGRRVTLRSSPGKISPEFSHFELIGPGGRLDVWTDIEFLTLSHDRRGSPAPKFGDYHELDIAIVEHGATGRPRYDQIALGVECKHRGFRKDLLRTVLGVRRELSLLADPHRTAFTSWPRATVPALPASCLLVYCSSQSVNDYSSPGDTFGIDFFFEPPP